MSTIPYASPADAQRLPFKDRRTSLMVIGVLLLILGAMSGCVGAMTPLGMFLSTLAVTRPGATSRPAPGFRMDAGTMASAVGTYAGGAAVLIWVGVGAVRLRRWVRPVGLVFSGTWLVMGVFGLVYWLVGAPNMSSIMAASTPPGAARPPAVFFNIITWATGIFIAVLMIVLPSLIFSAFYRRGVRETLEFFDPRVRWTDACPIPVLTVSGWLVLAAAMCLLYAAYAVLPLFGILVAGPVAAAGLVLVAGTFALLAVQTYRLRPSGWWGALIAITLWCCNLIWTFSRTGWDEFYRKAGYSPAQTEMIQQYGGGYQHGVLWMVGFWMVVWVGCLLYVRRYFWPTEQPTTSS